MMAKLLPRASSGGKAYDLLCSDIPRGDAALRVHRENRMVLEVFTSEVKRASASRFASSALSVIDHPRRTPSSAVPVRLMLRVGENGLVSRALAMD